MGRSYYYFAASLPMLQLEGKPSITLADFLDDALRLLSEADSTQDEEERDRAVFLRHYRAQQKRIALSRNRVAGDDDDDIRGEYGEAIDMSFMTSPLERIDTSARYTQYPDHVLKDEDYVYTMDKMSDTQMSSVAGDSATSVLYSENRALFAGFIAGAVEAEARRARSIVTHMEAWSEHVVDDVMEIGHQRVRAFWNNISIMEETFEELQFSDDQRRVMHIIVLSCLPHFYKEAWAMHRAEIMRRYRVKNMRCFLALICPRRFGKSYMAAAAAASMTACIPGKRGALCAPTKGTAGKWLLDQTKKFLTCLPGCDQRNCYSEFNKGTVTLKHTHGEESTAYVLSSRADGT